jgi:glycosyltransferase involved in cell wall biosynthesis
LAEQLAIADRVILPGFVRDVPALLSVVDVYVQPNIKVALGSALIEAAAAARPVVATRTGGHPEVVLDGETGRLCPPSDPEAMAEAIASLIERPPEELAAMGRRGRERAVALFDQDRMVEAVEQVCTRVAGAEAR